MESKGIEGKRKQGMRQEEGGEKGKEKEVKVGRIWDLLISGTSFTVKYPLKYIIMTMLLLTLSLAKKW